MHKLQTIRLMLKHLLPRSRKMKIYSVWTNLMIMLRQKHILKLHPAQL